MSDLRFPIGPFTFPETVSAEERAAYLEALRNLSEELRTALAGLPEARLETIYRPGGWTIRQVVHHIADSHMNCYIRFKLAATEDTPTVKPYNEVAWAELRDGKSAPVALSLSLLDALQQRWVMFLESLDEGAWARTFRHPDLGEVRLDKALALYAWHGRHHVAHITAVRERENF